jgi:hypothetical protein
MRRDEGTLLDIAKAARAVLTFTQCLVVTRVLKLRLEGVSDEIEEG